MKTPLTRRAVARPERGAALIEALVAILVLSIGLLGLVGLQTASVRFEQNAWARNAIASHVSDLADRIRANPGAGDTSYVYMPGDYATERTNMAATSTFSLAVDCATAVCTAAQLADYDIKRWRLSLNESMPGAVGLIGGSRASAYTVTIAYFDKSNATGSGTTLASAQVCSAAPSDPPGAKRSCCPDVLSAPAGARCVNFTVIP